MFEAHATELMQRNGWTDVKVNKKEVLGSIGNTLLELSYSSLMVLSHAETRSRL